MICLLLLNLAVLQNLFNISNVDSNSIRYVAIGDSYTTGTGIEPEMSWPSQLSKQLRNSGVSIDFVANLAQGGWTSKQAVDSELPLLKGLKPDFVTLQIGVNDWIQGVSSKRFKKNLKVLINGIQKNLPRSNNLLIITIPDFSCSPVGSRWGYGKSAVNGIARFNRILKEEARSRELVMVEIYPLSQRLCSQPKMFSDDGLHPSNLQYTKWLNSIFPKAFELLQKKIK